MPATRRKKPGQPSALARTYDHNGPDGSPRTVAQALVDEIAGGEYLETACAYVGISTETARDALRIAAKLKLAALGHEPQPATDHEATCLAFSVAYARANAVYERDTLRALDEIGQGGRTIKSLRSKRRFRSQTDTTGFIVERIETVTEQPPDPQVLIWRMAHRFPKRYSPKLHVLTNEDVELPEDEHARELVAGIEGFLAGHATP